MQRRPDRVTGQKVTQGTGSANRAANSGYVNYINYNAFVLPAIKDAAGNVLSPFGNASRNPGRTPAFYETDFGIHKNFNITEGRFVQFRAEAFNLLNRTNFAPPGGLNSNSSGFGVFTSTFPARQVQLALKLVF